jgi:hypothetical protein
MRHAAALLGVLTLAAAGCGGGDAQQVLSRSANSLGHIRSGDLTLRLIVSPRRGTKGRVGFELRGPFSLRKGTLPVAKIAYTQIAGPHEATATFTSTGTKAYAEVNRKAYELPAQSAQLVRAAAASVGGSGLGGFDVASWFRNPKLSDGGRVGGAETDHVTGELDVVSAANGLLDFVRSLGRQAPRIEGQSARQLRDAVRSSRLDVWSGKSDHVLRRLLLKAELGFKVPASLRQALGDVAGARVEFELAVTNPNQPVTVRPPSNPLPSSQLPGG